jgi:hypothetical protein
MRIERRIRRAAPRVIVGCLAAIALPAAGAGAPAAHSASHPIPAPARTENTAVHAVFYQPPPAPLGLAVTGGKWSVYSRGVNRINAAAVSGSETWLATDMGLKRLDRSRGAETHFTRLDGLPDDRVLAVAAVAGSAWAITAANATQRADASTASLCEYAPAAGRWRVLREMGRPIVAKVQPGFGTPQPYAPGSPLENALVAACPEKLCVALSPVPRDDKPLVLCYDRRLAVWDEIRRPASLAGDPASTLSVTWMDVNRDEIWLATTAGLLRYRLREKVWQRYLPERMIYAATRATDGTLWLATYLPGARPAAPTAAAGAAEVASGHWFATHFAPRTGQSTNYQAPDAGPRQSAYALHVPQTFSGISIVGRGVWLTPGMRHPYGLHDPFVRLNPQDGAWKSYSVQAAPEMDAVPDAALQQPTLPRTMLQSSYFPWRLTDWICSDAIEIPKASPVSPASLNKDSDGTTWTTDGRALLQMDEHSVTLHRYSVGQLALPVTPQVSSVAVLNGRVYAMSSGDLQCYDPAAGVWQKIKLPRSSWVNPNDERLIPDGNRLWVGTPTMALRYDPGTQQFATECSSQNGGYRLLGMAAGAVWLRGPDSLLYRADLKTGDPEAAETAPLPAEIAAKFERPLPFGLQSGLIWFRLQDKKEPDKCLFAGYNPTTESWTRGYVTKLSGALPSCIGSGARTFFSTAEDSASIVCYDQALQTWAPVATKRSGLTLISVDDGEIVGIEPNSRSLVVLDRKTSTWTPYEMPQSLYAQQTGSEAVRAGATVFVATNLGVWEFGLDTHTWAQLPGFASRDIYLNGLSVDPASVWSIARPSNGNQAFAVRLDKATHRWSVWGEKQGFPEKLYPPAITPDGAGAWVLASSFCYHLGPNGTAWDNVSARLSGDPDELAAAPIVRANAGGAPSVQIASIAPDGDSVWLLPRSMAGGFPPAAHALLVRFDRRDGKFERLTPSLGPSVDVAGSLLQVDQDAVWIPTSAGVFRFGKAEGKWTKVTPPAAADWKPDSTIAVVERGGSRWFFGMDNAVRWTE